MRKYNKFALFILGMTGSGKSRVANQISLLNDFTLISGGSIFRNLAESDSEEDAKIAREIMSKGIGAPNELVIRLYRKSLEQLTPDSVVFDGNPKNLNQFFEILNLLKKLGYSESKIVAVWLDIPIFVVYKRLKYRLVCTQCGKTDNFRDYKCSCGGTLIRRNDDQEVSVIESKIKWFVDDVTPVIDYMREKNRLLRLCSSNKKVINQILSFIESLNENN
jgi:adenylate kinase family enzyme